MVNASSLIGIGIAGAIGIIAYGLYANRDTIGDSLSRGVQTTVTDPIGNWFDMLFRNSQTNPQVNAKYPPLTPGHSASDEAQYQAHRDNNFNFIPNSNDPTDMRTWAPGYVPPANQDFKPPTQSRRTGGGNPAAPIMPTTNAPTMKRPTEKGTALVFPTRPTPTRPTPSIPRERTPRATMKPPTRTVTMGRVNNNGNKIIPPTRIGPNNNKLAIDIISNFNRITSPRPSVTPTMVPTPRVVQSVTKSRGRKSQNQRYA